MKPVPVPHVDNCQNAHCVNFVEPVQEVGVNLSFVVTPVHTAFSNGQPQENGPSPGHVQNKIKHVKDVSSVDLSFCAPSVPNVPLATPPPTVGGRLLKFWQR